MLYRPVTFFKVCSPPLISTSNSLCGKEFAQKQTFFGEVYVSSPSPLFAFGVYEYFAIVNLNRWLNCVYFLDLVLSAKWQIRRIQRGKHALKVLQK